MRPALEAHVREQIAYEFAREGPPEDFPELPPVPGGRYTDPAFFELERQHLDLQGHDEVTHAATNHPNRSTINARRRIVRCTHGYPEELGVERLEVVRL